MAAWDVVRKKTPEARQTNGLLCACAVVISSAFVYTCAGLIKYVKRLYPDREDLKMLSRIYWPAKRVAK